MRKLLYTAGLGLLMTSCAVVKTTDANGNTTTKRYKLETLQIEMLENATIINNDTIRHDRKYFKH